MRNTLNLLLCISNHCSSLPCLATSPLAPYLVSLFSSFWLILHIAATVRFLHYKLDHVASLPYNPSVDSLCLWNKIQTLFLGLHSPVYSSVPLLRCALVTLPNSSFSFLFSSLCPSFFLFLLASIPPFSFSFSFIYLVAYWMPTKCQIGTGNTASG